MEKRRKLFLLFSTILCYLLLDFHVKTGSRISLREKRLFEISESEITSVDCISSLYVLMDARSGAFFSCSYFVLFAVLLLWLELVDPVWNYGHLIM